MTGRPVPKKGALPHLQALLFCPWSCIPLLQPQSSRPLSGDVEARAAARAVLVRAVLAQQSRQWGKRPAHSHGEVDAGGAGGAAVDKHLGRLRVNVCRGRALCLNVCRGFVCVTGFVCEFLQRQGFVCMPAGAGQCVSHQPVGCRHTQGGGLACCGAPLDRAGRCEGLRP